MSKKKDKETNTQEFKDTAEYYKVNKDAVSRLVEADESNAPEVSDEEIARVSGRKKKAKIPDLVKVLFIKWWFAGAVCFFFYFGLGTVVTEELDLDIILGLALGAVTDLLTNNVLKHFEPTDRAWDKYMLITVRKFWSLFLNVIYGGVILYLVIYIYNLINICGNKIQGTDDKIVLGVEPLLFGVFVLLVDSIFILIKNTFKKIIDDAKAGNRR